MNALKQIIALKMCFSTLVHLSRPVLPEKGKATGVENLSQFFLASGGLEKSLIF